MRSLRGLLALSGHLPGRHAPASGASSSPHSALFARALQILSQPEPVRLEKLSAPDSGIVELRLERPEARNAIGKEMLKGLRSAMDKVEADPTANVLLLASSVPKVFCAGADLKERRLMGPCEVREFVNSLRATFSSFETLSIPTIAVVEGAAFGGGLELALSCDLRICGESATFSLPETGLAIIPGYVSRMALSFAAASSRSCFAAGICSPSHRCDHAGSNPSNELGWNACREKIIAKLYHESNQINHVRSIACISNYSDPSQPINQSLEGGANICEEERHEPRPYLKNSVPLQGARGMVFPSLFVLRRVFV
ncbi:enoyl-CoA hydratase domain-containing protein 2, mitochondrial isoform X1 [Brachypodium distachyon]|uniref:enoyl-CoA hydratase domain-containing protein 2, mitochondrial isoform X1 n=1 Tax=Brachypodium distachyon TaxID=15368 RepID=UPI0005300B73|nr:enoyl-CoA hydratase domain-containing protein 2, mitochondrial isoform X1 [Brachypodium distachyon]|eukprot:XP_010235783.1 enoyl-CoA hydratase domain-containing protein 2, mitochondrial isoform X1 [Brachypodium distachyon]